MALWTAEGRPRSRAAAQAEAEARDREEAAAQRCELESTSALTTRPATCGD